MGRTAQLTSRSCTLNIIQQISVLNILNVLHNLRSFLFKMPFIHNSTSFGTCIIHILNTGCAKILKKSSGAKGLKQSVGRVAQLV
jgi:hypothetical protein